MAVVHYVSRVSEEPDGSRRIAGKLTLGVYATGGAALNLANYFASDSVPDVFVDTATNAAGDIYPTLINAINAETVKVLCLQGAAATASFPELNTGLELTAQNTAFWAVGQPFG